MSRPGLDSRRPVNPLAKLARLPTGAKMFLILSAALLPLALIGVFATLQTSRVADLEARSRLRVAAAESSRALGIEFAGDMTALRAVLEALLQDPDNQPSCARAQGVFAQQSASGARFAISRGPDLMCGVALPGKLLPIPPMAPDSLSARLVPGRGLTLTIASRDGNGHASAFFPVSLLHTVAEPSGLLPDHSAWLEQEAEDEELTIQHLDGLSLSRTETVRAPVGVGGLTLVMRMPGAPLTSPVLVAMLLPVLMWAAAVGIGWFVVDRLLIRPLRHLRATVAAYRPGELVEPAQLGELPAREIGELGETFRAISRTVQLHEADLAESLSRQTRLTREVHHRVKNNLQVIASLINFHARSARGPEAAAAYASIQRRVDALAVVHRHHFAEMEENRGLSLRSVIGELASNLRAAVSEENGGPTILLEIEPFLVSQDVAVAVAFLLTELIELALNAQPAASLRLSVTAAETPDRAILRVSSPALIESDALGELLQKRYQRVMDGLSRQLRSRLHHDPLVGAFELPIAVLGRD